MSAPTRPASRLSRAFALALTAVLAAAGLLVTATPALAAELTDTIDGITYVVDNTKPDDGATITDYNPTIGGTQVIIPDTVRIDNVDYPVTIIGNFAFDNNQLTEVTIADSVTTIGHGAFHRNLLTEVTIPDSVTIINRAAFAYSSLNEVTFGDSLTTIGLYAFEGTHLTEVTFPDSVTTLGEGAFMHNPLTSVRFTGPKPSSIYGVDPERTFPSLGFRADLIVYFPPAYGEPALPGGYTSPEWRGYTTYPFITYTVTFDTGDGSAVPDVPTVNMGTVAEPADAPTRTGYAFTGWYTDPDGTIEYNFATSVTEDLTLYAGWQINTYSVTFDTGDGSTVPAVTVDYGDHSAEPADPTRDGYSFTGWFTDPGATDEFNFTTPITSDLTLYAGWLVNTYTVTFDTGDGSTVPAVTVDYGDHSAGPADPVRDGYTFTGWYADPDGTTEYDFDTRVIGDLTLYAGWDEKVITPVSPPAVDSGEDDTLADTGAPPTPGRCWLEWWRSSQARACSYSAG